MKDIKVLSIIPARSGSKGLKGKNIANLAGKPLLAWSIEASLASAYITKTVVSSDSEAILEIAKGYSATPLKRPPNLALDTTPSEAVITHTLNALLKGNEIYDFVILLQPTSPLRNVEDIDKAFKRLYEFDADGLISVYKEESKILKAFIENKDGSLKGISNNDFPFMPRQELPSVYMSNGAIYIIRVSEFLKNSQLYTDRTISYEMSKEKSIDIDTLSDLTTAQTLLKSEHI